MPRTLKAAFVALILGTGSAAAQTGSGADIGTLRCQLTDIQNQIVYTNEIFNCEFAHNDGSIELYKGRIHKLGVDLSIKNNVTLIWAVFAPTDDKYEPRALVGTYVGAGADIAVIGGFGAKVLVGGGGNSFSLQPVSVSGVVGSGASVAFETFKLE